ncbi:HAD-IA family hydrolase [Aestuariibius sp. 2305UL40-4]|uniref:HAD-IA family hydrolase n=1 Tax=Aestuariibius violaceus TaxID=3234132 RepID=UPI00345ED2FF
MRSVIFDLDGTLADTSGDLIAAANACFRDLGLGDLLEWGSDNGVAFRGGRAMLTEGFSRIGGDWQAEIDRQYPRLLDYYGAEIDRHTVLYPGVREAVAALSGDGYAVAVCTNKPERLAEILLQRLGFRDAFGALVGADTLPVRKPDPAPLVAAVERAGGNPARACLVGDTVTDRETARAAGAASILVTFGPEGDAVKALEPEALLEDYAELPGIVARLEL